MSDLDRAFAQHAALRAAADASPIRQVRDHLGVMADEWFAASAHLAASGDAGVIELAGVVVPGMKVWDSYDLSGDGRWVPLRRVLRRDGITLHYVDPDTGRDVYRNVDGIASPVVVAS